jgi:nitrogen fixation-related uncharacterized protein
MQSNKSKGRNLIILCILLVILSVYIFEQGISSSKYDDGSGLGILAGQAANLLAAVIFLFGLIIGFVGINKYKKPQ